MKGFMDVTGKQIAAARALLEWTQQELADKSGVNLTSVKRFEKNIGDTRNDTRNAIVKALQEAGIDFTDDGGIRPRPSNISFFEGSDSYLRILDDVYYTLKNTEGEALFICMDDRKNSDVVTDAYRRARKAGIRMRFLVEEDNTFLMGKPDEYRYIPQEYYHNNPQVIYGSKIATMIYSTDKKAVVIENAPMVAAQRNIFNLVWGKAKKARRSDAPTRYDI